MEKLTNDKVINKLKSIYGESLDYSKVQYTNSRSYITLICPIHGEFQQYANNALQGRGGCPKCKLGISNLSEFIKASIDRFGDKFNYDKTKFKNLSTKVIITCPIHGDFEVVPRQFLQSKYGCSKCYKDSLKVEKPRKLTPEEIRVQKQEKWIESCTKIHNNKYDYSKVKYIKNSEKVCIICPEHGEFWQTPTDHKSGRGCPKCGYVNRANKTRISQEEFEFRANEKWNNKYTYGKYKSMHSYIEVICPEHGSFYVTPHNHLVDCGCPECSKSSGELIIAQFLKTHNIQYISQYKINIDSQINVSGIAKIDFYLPKYNCFIEYNGIQHYKPIKHFGGEIKFNRQIQRDEFVRNYCRENSIKLIEIPYNMNSKQIFNELNNLFDEQVQEKAQKS